MQKILCASLLALLSACGNDNGGSANPDTGPMGCAVEPTFSSLHDELFSTNRCAIAGCHASSSPQGNLDFQAGKAGVRAALLGGTFNPDAAGQFPNRVEMSDADASFLYEKVSKTVPVGGGSGRMPPGIPLMECEIEAIREWIDAGAPDD
jgi:hypothetical protein